MVKRIKFFIDAKGEVSLTVEGVQGKECEGLTEPFESFLGKVTQREFKETYYAPVTNEISDNQIQEAGNDHSGNGQA